MKHELLLIGTAARNGLEHLGDALRLSVCPHGLCSGLGVRPDRDRAGLALRAQFDGVLVKLGAFLAFDGLLNL